MMHGGFGSITHGGLGGIGEQGVQKQPLPPTTDSALQSARSISRGLTMTVLGKGGPTRHSV